jgi:hypothetical protein
MLYSTWLGVSNLMEKKSVTGFARLLAPKRRNVNVSGRRERAGGDRQRDQG